ncbi:GUN4 domain-containing protein [Nostoc sp.]|uniref:GUN4 domain-containing protein n=1 Tax=Nostoc sp. TaxID=1180 RepID=UPI002FF9EB48
MTEQMPPTKVFISYSWDSDDHKNNVLELANSLKNYGIDSKIDRYQQAPSEGWYQWMMNQIEESNFVLVVCTEKYNLRYRNKEKRRQGLGATWEGGLIIAELYDGQGINDKFIPVLLSSEDEKYIPSNLRTYTIYRLFDAKYDPTIPGEFQNLYRRLSNQPEYEEPKLGKRLILPPIQPASSNVGGDGEIIKGEALDNTQKEAEQQQVNDPEIEYRKKVEGYVYKVPLSEPYNEISEIPKFNLAKTREKVGLDTERAKAIENAVLQSRSKRHEEYKQNMQQYQNVIMGILEREGYFSDENCSDLTELKNTLALSDKDTDELLLYTKLEYSLKRQEWIEADEITKNLLLKVANVQEKYFTVTDFQKIPCKDIRKIDKLWTDYSKGHFGYSAQTDIWQQVNRELFDFLVELDWGYKEDHRFVYTDKFKYNLPNPPKGHLPALVLWDGGTNETRGAYIKRIQQCCQDVL